MLGDFLAVDLLLTFWRWILPFWRWDRNIHCQKVGDVSRKPFWRWMTLLAVHVTLLAVDVVTFWRWMCFSAPDPDIHCRPEAVDELWVVDGMQVKCVCAVNACVACSTRQVHELFN